MDMKSLLMGGGALFLGYLALGALEGTKLNNPLVPSAMTSSAPATVTNAQGQAEDYVIRGYSGETATGPIFAHDRSRAVFIRDALQDWREARESEAFGQVQLVNAREACDMPAPQDGARIANLFVSGAGSEVGMYTFSKRDVARGTHDWLDNIRKGKPDKVPGPERMLGFRVFDIAVTQTSAPVHLILQSRTEGVLQSVDQSVVFNLHLAPGAKVSGVSILGGRANAVANIDPSVPVSVITDEGLANCGLRIAVRDVGERLIKKKKLSPGKRLDKAQAELSADIDRYNAWFLTQFGMRSDESVRGISLADGALVGPVPNDTEQAPVYQPLSGAYVKAQVLDYVKVTGLHQWPQAFRDEVIKVATMVAGGDPRRIALPNEQITERLK